MGRSRITPIQQPDEVTCGPTSLKIALQIIGKRKSLSTLRNLCQTSRNGTTTNHMLTAIRKLGLSALIKEKATLRHLKAALKTSSGQSRAVMVCYCYGLDENSQPDPDKGHWATVASFSDAKNRIVLFDSYIGKRKSYHWHDFRARWMESEKKKRTRNHGSYTFIEKKQPQFMMVVSDSVHALPKFTGKSVKILHSYQ